MTLEEAINTYTSNAEYERTHGNLQGCLDFKQLAEWLKELKRLKEQEPVLDKIRAEILEEKECAYADFERYKVEYLGQGCQEAYDSLPYDDFRYGMERAIEIIDKYKTESEDSD